MCDGQNCHIFSSVCFCLTMLGTDCSHVDFSSKWATSVSDKNENFVLNI